MTDERQYERPAELIKKQNAMLLALKRFHQICEKNNIQYSLHGGTLLGAIREKGFIPWDDDADVSMTRSNYNRLRRIARDYEDCNTLFDDSSGCLPRFIMRAGEDVVWMDLFVYDYISEWFFPQKMKIYTILLLDAFSRTKETIAVTRKYGKHKGIEYALFYLAYKTGSILPIKDRIGLMHSFSEKCLCGKRRCIFRSNDQYSAKSLILPAETMDAYTSVPFEDTQLMVTTRYKDVLASSYGEDYMIPKMDTAGGDNSMHDGVRSMLLDAFKMRKLTEENGRGGVTRLDLYRRKGLGMRCPSEGRAAA